MKIHSNQRGSEKEENVQRLIELEQPKKQYRDCIHVNMLKEGWDVTNLYTIIRCALQFTDLTEQTIGRGLVCPMGSALGSQRWIN